MAIGTNRVAYRERISLPGVAGTFDAKWLSNFYQKLSDGATNRRIPQYMVLDNVVVTHKKIVVHMFTMGDVDDPDLYAAEPLWQWQQTEAGKWVMENATDTPEWHRQVDHNTYGYKYAVTAILAEKKLTEYYLRFGISTKNY